MKKTLKLILAALVLLTTIYACGNAEKSGGTNATDSTTLDHTSTDTTAMDTLNTDTLGTVGNDSIQ